MKAITFARFGGPEVLELTDVPDPHATEGTVRVRVRAAGVNPIDWKVRRGMMEKSSPTTFPSIPGVEIAGTVDEVGPGVGELAVGDEVLGWTDGGYAEYALARQLVRKPPDLSWELAAALPVAGETALRVLDELGVRSGETIVVHGASGAVGSLAVQLAKARGAEVIGTASAESQDAVRSLGATPVLYGDGLVERVRAAAPKGVSAAFDAAGRGALPALVELTGGTSRVITIADPEAERYGVHFSSGGGGDRVPVLKELVDQLAAGALKITIASTFPLSAAAKAQAISEAGHARGKLILTP